MHKHIATYFIHSPLPYSMSYPSLVQCISTTQPPSTHCASLHHAMLLIHTCILDVYFIYMCKTIKWLFPLVYTRVFSMMTQIIFDVVVLGFGEIFNIHSVFYFCLSILLSIPSFFLFLFVHRPFSKSSSKKHSNMHAKSIHTNKNWSSKKLDVCFLY